MLTIMENQSKPKKAVKRKPPLQTISEPKNKNHKLTDPVKKSKLAQKSKHSKKKTKVVMSDKVIEINPLEVKLHDRVKSPTRSPSPILKQNGGKKEAIVEEKPVEKAVNYPILEDKELIEKFMKVPMNNNQKGRIRQEFKTQLQGSNDCLLPDVINGKIQSYIKKTTNLTESDLRRIRILYNMLKASLEKKVELPPVKLKKKKEKKDETPKLEGEKELPNKVKGPKRYVVFLGNLPLDVTKDTIMSHFSELNEHIKDIRLQKPTAGKKSAFAYVELGNEPSYELALSKHHSMLGNKRINVLYTTQKNSKISKAEAKSKSAKLIALQKTGKLIGSVPMAKKRSHRRTIMKKARAKEEAMKT